MTKKRYKKLLMSTGIQRNLAEQLSVWGRHMNIQIDRRTMLLDSVRVCMSYTLRDFTTELFEKAKLIEAAAAHMATILSGNVNDGGDSDA